MPELLDRGPDVSVVIVNYKTADLVLRAVSSIFNQTSGVNFEVIVVNNDSADNVSEIVGKKFREVKFIECRNNIGFGKANNLASLSARGKYFFLMNPDSFIKNNALKVLFDSLESNLEIGAAGGNLFGENLLPGYSFCRDLPGYFTEIDDFFLGVLSRVRYGKNLYHNFSASPLFIRGAISGAGLFIRSDYFKELKGFDPDFFMYYEDTELFHRLHKRKCKVAVFPDIQIVHSEGKSEPKKEKTIERSLKSKWIYLEKCKGRGSLPVFYFFSCLVAWQRVLVFSVLKVGPKKKYWMTKLRKTKETYRNHISFYSKGFGVGDSNE